MTDRAGTSRRLVAFAMAVAGAAAGYACGNPSVHSQTAPADAASRHTTVPGEYIVTLAAAGDVKEITDLYGRFGIKSIRELAPNVFLVILAEDPGPATMEQLRGGNVHIKAVEPNLVYRIQGTGSVR